MIRPRKAQPGQEVDRATPPPKRRTRPSAGRLRAFMIGLIGLFACVLVVTLLPNLKPSFGQSDAPLVLLPTVTPTPLALALTVEAAAAAQEPALASDKLPAQALDAPAASLDAATPLPTATPFPTPTPPPFSATINVLANLRVGPGTHYSVVRYGEPGEVVTVIGMSPDGEWYRLSGDLWIAVALVDKDPSVP